MWDTRGRVFEGRSPVPRGSWPAPEHNPVHQRWPPEHLLLSPAGKLHFSFQLKDTGEAAFSPLLLLHKYLLNQYLEKHFSLSWLIWQTS